MAELNNEIFETLDSLLKSSNLEDVTNESTGFEPLPDGYYLSEVESAELKVSKSSNLPMVALKFNVCENGVEVSVKDNGETVLETINKSKNRKIFMYYVFKDEGAVKRFASDMLKFEDENGDPILPKEAFLTSETLMDALDILVGRRAYVHSTTSEKDDGTKSTWSNLISWKRAALLGLPQ